MSRKAVIAAIALMAAAGALAWPAARSWWRERAVRGAPRPLSVLLVTLDTTRADRLGCYGRAGASTPHLDALAASGVLFRQAYAHVPLTCPSHTSLLTGRLPTRHGVRDNGGYVLAPEIPTVAERFQAAGHRTGAFVSAFVLDRRFGLARGFATYHDRVPARTRGRPGRPQPPRGARRGDRRAGDGVAVVGAVAAVLPVGAPLRSAPSVRAAGAVRLALSREPVRRRDRVRGRAAGAPAGRGRGPRRPGRGHGRPRRGAGRPPGGDAQLLRLQQHPARAASCCRCPGTFRRAPRSTAWCAAWTSPPRCSTSPACRALPETDGTSLVPWLTGAARRRRGPRVPRVLPSRASGGAPRSCWGCAPGAGSSSRRRGPSSTTSRPIPASGRTWPRRGPPSWRRCAHGCAAFNAGGPPTAAGAVDAETARNLRALGYVGAGPAARRGPAAGREGQRPRAGGGHARPRAAGARTAGGGARAVRAGARAEPAVRVRARPRGGDAAAAGTVRRRVPRLRRSGRRASERGDVRRHGEGAARDRSGPATRSRCCARAAPRTRPARRWPCWRAGCCSAAGDAQGAEAAARSAVAIAPADEAARGALADALDAQKRTAEALTVRLALAEEQPAVGRRRARVRAALARRGRTRRWKRAISRAHGAATRRSSRRAPRTKRSS